MSELFVPGEYAYWQALTWPHEGCNGQEVRVLSYMEWGEWYDPMTGACGTGLFYEVRDSDGQWLAMPWELRKKHPPAEAQEAELEVLVSS